MADIKLINKNCKGFITGKELNSVSKAIKLVHKELKNKRCPGNDYIGWLNLPSTIPNKLIVDIEKTAKNIRKN